MSMQEQTGPGGASDDDDTLAAEYVLHLLDGPKRAEIEDRLDVDGAFRARVAGWAERLVPLADSIDPVAPPPELRNRVDAAITRLGRDARAALAPSRRRFALGGWLGGGLVAAALAVLAVLFLPQTELPAPGPVYVAEVEAPAQQLVVQASFDAGAETLTVRRERGAAPEGRVLQVWLLTEDQPPHAIGTFADGDEVTVPVSQFWGERIPTGQFAVSEEPPGGSTDETGPRGEVLAVGQVEEL